MSLSLTHSFTHSLSLSLTSLTHTLSLFDSLSLSLSLSLPQTSYTLSSILSLSLSFSHSLFHKSLTHTLSLPLPLSLSLPLTYTLFHPFSLSSLSLSSLSLSSLTLPQISHTLSLSLTHSFIHSLSLLSSLSLSHSLFHKSLTHSLSHSHTQFKCCGLDSSKDWFDLNPQAVQDNGDVPPGKCSCDLSDKRCERVVTEDGTEYNAWQDVNLRVERGEGVIIEISILRLPQSIFSYASHKMYKGG